MRRRKRLRIDRIIYTFVIFNLFIFLIIFSIYSIINKRIYDSIKNDNLIKTSRKEIKVWKKTVNYVNEKKDYVTILHKKNYVTIDSNYFKNGLGTNLNIYDKTYNNSLFDNIKGLYIEKNELLSSSNKLKIRLPKYLYKREIVDLYGIKNKNIVLLKPSVKIEDKYISFDINTNYDDYFITYVPVKSISSSNNINITVGEKRNLNIRLNPRNSTNTNLKYKYDKKYISMNGEVITGKKKGSIVIKVTSTKENISKDIKITVKAKEKKVIKEETKKEVIEETNKLEEKDGITYIDGIMIVNKTYSLPSSYNPGGLTDEFMDAFYEMQSAAKLDNISLFIASGFRSYDYQKELYDAYVASDGKENADTYSARAGYSEHQTGLAADINSADSSFEDTKEAIWLDKNCYKYGFVVRFPKGKEEFTGYKYEPWHLRYVGKTIAAKIHDRGGISLEEYYGLTSKYKD